MSRFNTDLICSTCDHAERQHPDYEKAVQAELEAIRQGDFNFPGIGLPPETPPASNPEPEGPFSFLRRK
jgi:hypothetical protein